MFEVLGVIDLRNGAAVHARGGQRDRYLPVDSIAGEHIVPGDALSLARAYENRLGLTTMYVADLDAIITGTPQEALTGELAALGAALWLDAGVTSVEDARRALRAGATRVVVGLETLPSFDALDAICSAIGGHRVAFSLDLRTGQPIGLSEVIAHRSIEALTLRAADAGVGSVIVLDVARVGTVTGLDLDLITEIRRTIPGIELFTGGGIRGWDDLVALADAGCRGALIATALQSGRITASEISAARLLAPARGPST